jgi:hypothetical protein
VKPPQVIRARIVFDGSQMIDGKIMDLSMGGMALLLNEWTDSQCTSCVVRFRVPIAPLVFELQAEVIHRESGSDGLMWGLRFTDLEDMHKNLEHTVLYRFLVSAYQKQQSAHPTRNV